MERRKERGADGAAGNFFLDRLILPLTSTVLTNGIRMTLALMLNLGKRFSRVIFTENRLRRRRKSLSNNARERAACKVKEGHTSSRGIAEQKLHERIRDEKSRQRLLFRQGHMYTVC